MNTQYIFSNKKTNIFILFFVFFFCINLIHNGSLEIMFFEGEKIHFFQLIFINFKTYIYMKPATKHTKINNTVDGLIRDVFDGLVNLI